ncbi:MAG: hypothetical protein HY901_04685 [Deltaproteobacteria bacterium]|nr:hypothetical protein [Deltaproteobacteria bacterium]
MTWFLAELGRGAEVLMVQGLRYILGTWVRIDEAVLSEALKRAMPEKEKKMLSIAAKEWLAQGEAKGKAEGKAEDLLHLLERRFGQEAAEYRQAIAEADTEKLERWFDRAIDALSIEVVFAESQH